MLPDKKQARSKTVLEEEVDRLVELRDPRLSSPSTFLPSELHQHELCNLASIFTLIAIVSYRLFPSRIHLPLPVHQLAVSHNPNCLSTTSGSCSSLCKSFIQQYVQRVNLIISEKNTSTYPSILQTIHVHYLIIDSFFPSLLLTSCVTVLTSGPLIQCNCDSSVTLWNQCLPKCRAYFL